MRGAGQWTGKPSLEVLEGAKELCIQNEFQVSHRRIDKKGHSIVFEGAKKRLFRTSFSEED